MRLNGSELSELLRARPLGEAMWIRGTGQSMAPLLRSGDSLFVRRCEPHQVARGDLVMLLSPPHKLIAHLVVSSAPLVTSGFLGHQDPPGLQILGRVEKIRRGPITVPLPVLAQRPTLWAHRAAVAAYRTTSVRKWARELREWTHSPITAPLRRWRLGEIEARPLEAADEEKLLIFAGDWLGADPVFLSRQLRARWSRGKGLSVGAFTSAGRMVGFSYLDSYREEGVPLDGVWIRHLMVAPIARGMGVAPKLVTALIRGAEQQGHASVCADVRVDNAPSLAVFRRCEFVESPGRGEEIWAARRTSGGAPWVWLERRVACSVG